ncbi:MAG: DUF1622 domain-containing protein [Desulfovibrionales bacterium]
MERIREIFGILGFAMEAGGVLIIVGGALFATWRLVTQKHRDRHSTYKAYRQDVGRSILLGLEFLVAGDIIRTVVVDLTMQSVLVLGLIVIIRTLLSMSLEIEVEGRLPWKDSQES